MMQPVFRMKVPSGFWRNSHDWILTQSFRSEAADSLSASGVHLRPQESALGAAGRLARDFATKRDMLAEFEMHYVLAF